MASVPVGAEQPPPQHPWAPATLRVWGIYRRERDVWVRDSRTRERTRKREARYDVRYNVDGREYRFGFDQRGWAKDFADQLRADFARGALFDPRTRRFVPQELDEDEEESASAAAGPTFFAHACEYLRHQWHRWAPGTRPMGQLELARACLYLVRDGAPALDAEQRVAADAYLRRVALTVPRPDDVTDDEQAWEDWFDRWSLPLGEVTDAHLRRFLDTVRRESIDGTPRSMSKSGINRTRMYVRRCFAHAKRRRLIDWDPWDAVDAERMRDHDQADPDLVMDPAQVRALARACAAINPRYEAFVLIQGLCGLRPGEALALRRRDLELDATQPRIVVRGSHSTAASRFFTGDKTPRRPLKGRGERASRAVPVPRQLVAVLRHHLNAYVGKRQDALVFTNTAGNRISLSNFHRDVWRKARETVFAEDDPLRRVRRHDLRHSAITAWLNAGVPLKVAQTWSGHKTASVLLKTFLGVLRGDEELGWKRWQEALDRTDKPAKS